MRLAILILAAAILLPFLHIPTTSADCSDEHGAAALSCTVTHLAPPGAATCTTCVAPVAQFGIALLLVAGFVIFLAQEQSNIFFSEHAPPIPPPRF